MPVLFQTPRGKCKILKVVSSAVSGSRKVRVTFPSHGRCTVGGLNYLLILLEYGVIEIPTHDKSFLAAVRDTLDWEGYENLTFVVNFLQAFDLDFAVNFTVKMAYSLEDIDIAE